MTKLAQFNNDEFKPYMFVVDPAGCGCTDCILGYSTPEDGLDQATVYAAWVLGFRFIDRR